MKRSYLIAGTGTDVGKTFTTCALLHAARSKGIEAVAYKPLISGWVEEGDSDTAHLLEASGYTRTVEQISPWRLKAPLSPHLAAKREGVELKLQELTDWSKAATAGGPELQFIEAVGGVAVPINNQHTTLDWMQALNLPTILVTGSYLGSISHTLTALYALQNIGVSVKALVVNESACSSVTMAEAEEGLWPFLTTIPLRIFQPRVSSCKDAHEIHRLLADL